MDYLFLRMHTAYVYNKYGYWLGYARARKLYKLYKLYGKNLTILIT